MDIKTYREHKLRLQAEADAEFRPLCSRCLQSSAGCYCSVVREFDPEMKFVILIHPIEVRRRIATGRMSHLCLQNSTLVRGEDYTHNAVVNSVLNDPSLKPVILYPGADAANLTAMTTSERAAVNDDGRKLAIFVIDGTWNTARKMMNRSLNLHGLPKICFTPPGPSRFRVRKQPGEICYSTIEAIHQTIELLGPSQGFNVEERAHDTLLKSFDWMVERQLEYIREAYELKRGSRHRRDQQAS